MSALHAIAIPETLSSASYLDSVTARCPALASILGSMRQEPLCSGLEDVLAEAVMHLPHLPDLGPAAVANDGEDREAVISTELGWLARELGWLRSRFESAVFRRFAGAGRREDRDTARFYLALVARLFRLENVH
jgi:hypothetical protein